MKKAILIVSFGTTYQEALQAGIESIENKIRIAFPGYAVHRAFTSRLVIKRLAEQQGIQVDNEQQALARLQAEGYREVYIQPLHVVAGAEYDKIKAIVVQYAHAKSKVFDKIRLGRPLLYFMGHEDQPDDYLIAIKALEQQLPRLGLQTAIVFMGHGGVHPANAAYAALQMKLEEAGWNQALIYTVEGYPTLGSVIKKLRKRKVTSVTLAPFMLVAGDHANNDMAGDESDSAKSQLLEAGFTVKVYARGLGENSAIQDIYIQHLQDAMDQTSCHRVPKHS